MRILKLIMIFLWMYSQILYADDKQLTLYFDADLSINKSSASSILRGMQTALSSVNNNIGGYTLKIVPLDHRGNVLRSKLNFKKAADDPSAIAVMAGMHSPPLITNRVFINNLNLVTIVPWAAGAPITRFDEGENWVFRVSIDDAYAGEFLTNFAMLQRQCQRPVILLESTPWGDYNLKNIGQTLLQHGVSQPLVLRFGINLHEDSANILARQISRSEADCVILVANPIEGAIIAQALGSIDSSESIKLISHWGISAGRFEENVPHEIRQKLQLTFIQSCFSFMSPSLSDYGKDVLARARQIFYPVINDAEDITSPVGFIHAHDAMLLLIEALKHVDLAQNTQLRRQDLRESLENLTTPVHGLIKTYQQPFSAFDKLLNVDGHEALSPQDYCMAYYDRDGNIRLL